MYKPCAEDLCYSDLAWPKALSMATAQVVFKGDVPGTVKTVHWIKQIKS